MEPSRSGTPTATPSPPPSAGSDVASSSRNPVAEAWQVEYAQALPDLQRLASIRQPPWPLRVLRSSQLDALRLDAELKAMLHEQFMLIFQLLQPGRVSAMEPELNALLSLLIYRLSIWNGRASPGSELMNLRYRNERAMSHSMASTSAAVAASHHGGGRTGIEGPGLTTSQRVLFGMGDVLVPYIWAKLNRRASQQEWLDRSEDMHGVAAWRVIRWLESVYKVGVLANLWVFLYEGQYRSLLERILGARLVYKQANMSRLVSFEYMNRQLVWQELSEFLLFLLPLINVARLKQFIMGVFPKLPIISGTSTTGELLEGWTVAKDNSGKTGHTSSPTDAHLQAAGPCPVCGIQEILVPFVALPCRHVFCYFCLRGHTEADREYKCPIDGLKVTAMRRYAVHMAADLSDD